MKQLLIALAMLLVPVAYADFDAEVEALAKQMNSTWDVLNAQTWTVQTWTVETHKKQLTIPPFDLMEFLNFKWCRVTQSEDSHILKANWSMYALDIACDDHSSFPIVAPNYLYGEYKYTVAKVWKDKYMWDYITIDFALPDNQVGTLVYGHTSTPLKVWDTLKAWELVWMYSPTWKTTWPHTHLELWVWGKNLTFDMREFNPKSLRLRVQRWRDSYDEPVIIYQQVKETVQEVWDLLFRTMKFIMWPEWLRLKAYHDWGNRCSIWYWTKAKSCSEVITQEVARSRFQEQVEWRLNKMKERFPWKTDNQYIALTSYYYNCPKVVEKVLLVKGINKNTWMTCTTAKGKFMKWLYNRRLKEWNMYNTP